MHKPSASQTKKRNQVITVSPVIRPPHNSTETRGNQGTNGTRKARARLGCLRRRKMTPNETSTNANRVPILERSAASPISTSPAGIPTAKHAIQVDQGGVLNLGCTAEKSLGNRPS